MRKRWPLLAACLLLPLIWAVWRFGYDGADPRLIFRPRPPEAGESPALDEIVSLHVNGRPLREVLAELSEQHDVPIDMDDAPLKSAGIARDPVVSLDLEGVTLRTLLALLAQQADDQLIVADRDGGVLITTRDYWRATLGNYVSRIHRLDALLAADRGFDEGAFARLVHDLVAPDSWSDTAGNGKIELLPGALLVEQTPQAQREIEAVLAALAQLQSEPHRVEPLDVGISTAAQPIRRKILESLDRPCELSLHNASLRTLCEQISLHYGIPAAFELDTSQLVEFPRITCPTVASSISLRSALRSALREWGLTFEVRDDVLLITWSDSKYRQPRLRVYPVADLLDEQRAMDSGGLQDVLEEAMADAPWRFNVNTGQDCGADCVGGWLVVRHYDNVHRQIDGVLASIRHAHRPAYFPPSQRPEDVARRAIEAALREPTTVALHGTPLAAALGVIGERHGIPVLLDVRALHGVGVAPQSPVDVVARGVPLEHALRWMLRPLDLDLTVRDETLMITTPEEAEDDREVRFYPVGHIVGGFDYDPLCSLIETMLEPGSWVGSGPGDISTFGEMLVVPQTRHVHHEIASLLAALDEALHQPEAHEAIVVTAIPSPIEIVARRTLEQPVSAEFVEMPLADAIGQLGPAARDATPGLIERLRGEHGEHVARVLSAIDPSGRTAWHSVQRRIGDTTPLSAQRVRYEQIANEIRNRFGDAVKDPD